MAFKDFPERRPGVQLLQRSLERGRLAHAYLFTGHEPDQLEALARTLAKTLNCLHPVKKAGAAIDCCDRCLSCQKIDHENHADVFWVRPESKLRQIRIRQVTRRQDSPPRVLLEFINLKPTEAEYKVGVVVAADRMNEEAANAFLKTLEEPPAKSVLILLSTEPQRLLETILSRCLRLNFAGEGPRQLASAQMEWLASFSEMASAEQKSLLGRYRLLDVLLRKLNQAKAAIEETLAARSPLKQYPDAEEDLVEKWEKELAAASEAEYRRQRADLLAVVQWWLRDIWLQALKSKVQSPKSKAKGPESGNQAEEPEKVCDQLLSFPQLAGTAEVARRISAAEAMQNLDVLEQLQRRLGTNVQEALALEVSLLKLRL